MNESDFHIRCHAYSNWRQYAHMWLGHLGSLMDVMVFVLSLGVFSSDYGAMILCDREIRDWAGD